MRTQTIVLLAVCAILLGYALALWTSARNNRKTHVQEIRAEEHRIEAQAHANTARVLTATADLHAVAVRVDKAEVERLKRELAVIRENRITENAKEATIRQNRKVENVEETTIRENRMVEPNSEKPSPVADFATVEIEKLDAIVAAQDKVIADQSAQIQVLTAARDSWKEAYEAESRRSTALSLALDAQKAANSSARWQGRIGGFAVGLIGGYLAGGR